MKMNAKFGVATEDDLIGIVYVQATSWIDSYPSKEAGVEEDDLRAIHFHLEIPKWQHILRSPSYKVWVAKDGVNVLAFLAAWRAGSKGQIYQQHALPELRHQGLGTSLYNQAKNWLKDVDQIILHIPIHVQSGIAHFKKQGFKVDEEGGVDFIDLPTGKHIPTVVFKKVLKGTPNPTKEEPAEETAPVEQSQVQSDEMVGRARLAKLSGVRLSTIKYYTEAGLLPFEQKQDRLARRYELKTSLERLEKINQLQSSGLSIADIKNRLS